MNSNWSNSLLFVILVLLGLAGGWLLYDVNTYWTPIGTWDRIGELPAKPAELLGVQYVEVFVRSTDNGVYMCSPRTGVCETTSLQTVPSSRIPAVCKAGTIFTSPTPPGEVLDRLDYNCVGYVGMGQEQFSFVVLNDNSVWEWGKQFSEYEFLNLLKYLGGGVVVGFVAGIAMLIRRSRQEKKMSF